MQRDLGMGIKRGMNGRLCLRPDKMIRRWNVQHQRIGNGMGFVEHGFNHHAIIAHGAVHIGARGGHIGEPTPQTIANQANAVHGRLAAHTVADRL